MQKKLQFEQKKSIMGPIISVFVMVLVISILSGLTFLFIAQLKSQVLTSTDADVGVNSTAYQAVNNTEAAGYTIVGYLPLIFLAVIFGALLTLVLKIILPYVNLGQSMGGF
jgi:ABC-type multidrug transport system permease subunit